MINWKYVKGLWGNGTTSLYTFLEFKNNDTGLTDFDKVPVIKINDTNTLPAENATGNFGHIITEKASDQSIAKPFSFNDYVVFKKEIRLSTGQRIYLDTNNTKYIYYPSTEIDRIILHPHVKIEGVLETTGDISTDESITATKKCEAQYFNATSDIRAKTDIKILDINALDLIKEVNLYSFTYKDTNSKSIGVIAQELQSISIDGFKLVENENATGQDMDYMTVHESKIVYILWKAIQEQQKEIEELKLELKKRG